MKVLISGAGIAGLTVAYWLRRYGFSPTIVERAPSLLTGGYKIDVRGAALQVVRRMGVHDAVVAAGTDMQGAVLVDASGNVINRMSTWLLDQALRRAPGRMIQFFIDRSTRRIHQAANAITLKDYSSFLERS